jgi:hypothetical protein
MEGSFSQGRAFRWFTRNLDGSGDDEIATYPSAQGLNAFTHGRQSVPFGGGGYVVNIQDGAAPATGTTGDVYFTNNITSSPIAWTSLNSPTAATTGTGSVKVANLGGRPNAYYHTGSGNPESRGAIFRSTLVGATGAPGANWTPLSLPKGIGSVTAWDVDTTNGNRAIISGITTGLSSFEIHMTQDFGANWTSRRSNLMLAPGGVDLRRGRSGTDAFVGFGTYWQPRSSSSIPSIRPSSPEYGRGVFLSLDDGRVGTHANPTSPTSNSPHIPRPLPAYFSRDGSPPRRTRSTCGWGPGARASTRSCWRGVLELRHPGLS